MHSENVSKYTHHVYAHNFHYGESYQTHIKPFFLHINIYPRNQERLDEGWIILVDDIMNILTHNAIFILLWF